MSALNFTNTLYFERLHNPLIIQEHHKKLMFGTTFTIAKEPSFCGRVAVENHHFVA